MLKLPVDPVIVAIGASAGAIAAISTLVAALADDLVAVFLISVHRPAGMERHLAHVLSWRTSKNVRTACQGMLLDRPVYLVAPADRVMTVGPDLRIRIAEDEVSRTTNADLLFNSLALCAGPRTIAVALTGLLELGSEGLRAIQKAGGLAMVEGSTEPGFRDSPPSAMAANGTYDFAGTVGELAEAISRTVPSAVSPGPPRANLA